MSCIFLWIDDIHKQLPSVVTLRFTRVVFGVSSSPFLLNTTIKHYVDKYKSAEEGFVKRFTRSIYADDVAYGAKDDDSAFELYDKSREYWLKADLT